MEHCMANKTSKKQTDDKYDGRTPRKPKTGLPEKSRRGARREEAKRGKDERGGGERGTAVSAF